MEVVIFRGPKWAISKVFQAYFEPPPIFIIIKEILDRQSHALTRIIRGRYFDPNSPRKMADFQLQLALLEGVAFCGPKWVIPKVFHDYFEPPPNFIIFRRIF